jgi:hypothetical protein
VLCEVTFQDEEGNDLLERVYCPFDGEVGGGGVCVCVCMYCPFDGEVGGGGGGVCVCVCFDCV